MAPLGKNGFPLFDSLDSITWRTSRSAKLIRQCAYGDKIPTKRRVGAASNRDYVIAFGFAGARQTYTCPSPFLKKPRSPSHGRCRRIRVLTLNPEGSIALLRMCAIASSIESVA